MAEDAPSPSQLGEAIRTIKQTGREIARIVAELPEEALLWKPAADAWSIAEILGHVQEAMPYWTGEIRRVAASPGRDWGRNHQDEARLAAVAATAQRSTRDVIAGFGHSIDAVTADLSTLRDSDLQIEAPSRNPRFGVKPMSFVLDHLIVSHLRGHLDQITRTRDQYLAQVVPNN